MLGSDYKKIWQKKEKDVGLGLNRQCEFNVASVLEFSI